MARITEGQRRILVDAACAKYAARNPHIGGWESVTWRRSAETLVKRGFLTPYVHGGYAITEAGRAAIGTDGEPW